VTECGAAEIRSPKSEVRKKPENRVPKTERYGQERLGHNPKAAVIVCFRTSDFGLRTSFGFRSSGFGFAAVPSELRYWANLPCAGGSSKRLSIWNTTLLREMVHVVLAARAVASSASQPVKSQAAKVCR
jgi:hypothetical protein